MIVVGLMSGTSLDGIDAVLLDLRPRDGAGGYAFEVLRFETVPYDTDLRRALRAALPPGDGSVAIVAALHRGLGEAYARAAAAVAQGRAVDFVACHGQTLWHDGARRVTLQAGDPFAIREALHATVCFDFRSADCAAGGQGAPLIPYVDALLFATPGEDRVALNIGGIANVTLLGKAMARNQIVAFDTGPGNMVIDGYVFERTNGRQTFDRDGALAAAGRVDEDLLAAMLSDDYFAQPPPKSTGRERFGAHFLARFAERLARASLQDAVATLTELTAASISGAIEASGLGSARTIASGGGVRNETLLRRIAARLPAARVESSDAFGVPADAKEAIGFALLGYETLRGRAANVPSATGASHETPLGAIAPHELAALMQKIERECNTIASS